MKPTKSSLSKTFSLTAFLFFANNYHEQSEKLMPFLQEHNLTFERLNKKKPPSFFKQFPVFYKNVNCIVRSKHLLSREDCLSLSQLLSSQVQVFAFFYNNDMLTSLRVKQIQAIFLQSKELFEKNKLAPYTFWRYFSSQGF